MQVADREQFDEHLAILCAGFNVPVTGHRKHAYFAGLAKMSLAQFARVVEYAVSEDGPEDVPTTKAIWKIHRQLRRPSVQAAATSKAPADPDHLLYYANRMFLRHLGDRSGLCSTGKFVPGYGLVDCKASPEILAARKVVVSLVDWYSGPICEGDPDATPKAFIEHMIIALGAASPLAPDTLKAWREMAASPSAIIPFEPSMGRDLTRVDNSKQVALA